MDTAEETDLSALSFTELRVVALLADELTSSDIATRLGCSLRTVQSHRAQAAAKLRLEGLHRLPVFAIENRARVRACVERRKRR